MTDRPETMTGVTSAPQLETPRRSRFALPVALLVVTLLLVTGTGLWLRGGREPSASREIAHSPVSVADGSNPVQSAPPVVTGVFIEPGDGRAPLLGEIAAARKSIALEVYLVTDDVILRALEDARRRGIDVRVILEEHPFGGDGRQDEIFVRLEQAGIAVRWGNPVFRFTHIKTLVVDSAVAIIMNQNITESAFTSNRDFGVVTTQPEAVRTAAALFEADWARGPEPDPLPLVVSPTNARALLLEMIAGARRSLEIYAEVLRDPELLAAIAAAEARGVTVRLIVSPSEEFAAERSALAAGGVDIRLASSLYIHAKVIVADGERAFIGSQNLSATSLDQNRELGIIVDDPVNLARVSRTFELDFRSGMPEQQP
ncbi:MAG: hypothetical protein H0V00_10950 [Chloroflexia bacterium]|nr:hypothetical protein [Chloroflexia bacterium]